MARHFIATVRIVVEARDHVDAADGISESLRSLRPFLRDWAYLRSAGKPLTPKPIHIPDGYQEGDAFR